MMDPQVTVIMPNRNHGQFIPEALQALSNQKLKPARILFYDDASEDESLKITHALARDLPLNISIHSLKDQSGVVALCNRGLQETDTDLVYFASADDRVCPDFLSTARDKLAAESSAAFCSQASRTFGDALPSDETDISLMASMRDGYYKPDELFSLFRRHAQFIAGNATVYRVSHLRNLGGFPDLGPYSDGMAIMVLALRYGGYLCPQLNAEWRYAEESYSAKTRDDIDAARAYIARSYEYLAQALNEQDYSMFAKIWRGHAVHHLLSPRILSGNLKGLEDIAPVFPVLQFLTSSGYTGRRSANALALFLLAPGMFFTVVRSKFGF